MSRMMLVGEAWGAEEAVAKKAFVGASGRLLRALLHELDEKDPLFTNVFNKRPPQNNIEEFLTTAKPLAAHLDLPPYIQGNKRYYIMRSHENEIKRLHKEIELTDPYVIVAVGSMALYALTGVSGIMANRGYPYFHRKWRVYGTVHPAAVLRQYSWKPLLIADLIKAQEMAPIWERQILVPETVQEYEQWVSDHVLPARRVACDAETRSGQITVFGFAPTTDMAIVVPIWNQNGGSYWSEQDEVSIWAITREVFDRVPLVGQNFQYDISYFWKIYGIAPKKWVGDTMLQHHSLQPEMQKSLGFLGSLYASVPGWKHLRKEDGKELD